MCIIAGKMAGLPMMNKEIFENMYSNNDDGAGYMYADGGRVYIRKGFMTFDSFWNSLQDLGKTKDLNALAMVFHFRITTHGETSKANCHPFPIGEGTQALGERKTSCSIGMAHNGIIRAVKPKGTLSDTMQFVDDVVNPLYKLNKDFLKSKDIRRMLGIIADSKLMFLDSAGKIYTMGAFENEDGILYSNNGYSYSMSLYTSYNRYYSADWGDSTSAKITTYNPIPMNDREFFPVGATAYLYHTDPRKDACITVNTWNCYRDTKSGTVRAYANGAFDDYEEVTLYDTDGNMIGGE